MSDKLLMICPYWPPHGGPGVQRAAKFARYLPEHGIQPLVVTRAWRAMEDPSLLDEVANVPVREAFHVPFQRLGSVPGSRPKKARRYARLKDIRDWLQVPDHTITWVPSAAWHAIRWARETNPTALYSTSPYHATHLAALAVKKRVGLPWIAEFRDPWSDDLFTHFPTNLHRSVNRALEARVLRSADRIVTVSRGMRRDLLRSFPDVRTPIEVIYNGYDETDFIGTATVPQGPPFIIRHMGTLYPDRKPDVFLKGLANFISGHPGRAERFVVEFYGNLHADVASRLDTLRTQLGLRNVTFLPYVPHSEALDLIRKSHALLLIPGPGASTIPGKLFEYLATGRPILTVAPLPSGVDEITGNASDNPLRVNEDPEAVSRALNILERCLACGEEASLSLPLEAPTALSRSAASAKLANLIGEITA